jgi:hypothetical protein
MLRILRCLENVITVCDKLVSLKRRPPLYSAETLIFYVWYQKLCNRQVDTISCDRCSVAAELLMSCSSVRQREFAFCWWFCVFRMVIGLTNLLRSRNTHQNIRKDLRLSTNWLQRPAGDGSVADANNTCNTTATLTEATFVRSIIPRKF